MTMLRPASEMKDSGIDAVINIPKGWNVRRVKYILKERNERVEDASPNDLLSVSEYYGVAPRAEKIKSDGTLMRAESLEGYKICKRNDLVINIMLAWKGALGISDYEGIVSPSYCVYSSICDDVEMKYLHYLFTTDAYKTYFRHHSTGIIESRLRLYSDELFSLWCILPPLAEQQAIADYLDDRCSKIDEIIAEATASIEEYKELKQAVIYEAVTKGLDKNVPMKDSGVEWIPRIPVNWEVRRIASIYEESKQTGRDDLPILLVSIRTGISDREIGDDERDRKVIRSEDKTVYKVVHNNYLVYNMMRAWQGGFGAATVDGLVSPAYVVAKPIIDVNSSYIEYVLRTPNAIEHIRGLSYGVADFRLRLYWPYFKNIRVPLPPVEEQNVIVAYVQEQTTKMETLISEKQALIDDLQAYKKSLIYEIVTGKRRVV